MKKTTTMDATQVQRTELEEVQEDVSSPDISVEGGVSVEGAAALHGALDDAANAFDVNGFKCTRCNLVHQHDTNKHRLSDNGSTGVSASEAAAMEFNPNCHCGYNAAARKGIAGVSGQEARSRAPIPDETAREMDAMF